MRLLEKLAKNYVGRMNCKRGDHQCDPTEEDILIQLRKFVKMNGKGPNSLRKKCEFCDFIANMHFGGIGIVGENGLEMNTKMSPLQLAKRALRDIDTGVGQHAFAINGPNVRQGLRSLGKPKTQSQLASKINQKIKTRW